MAVGATNFPTSLDTVVELVEVTNDASTQLNGALTINATTITVDSTSLFPSSGIITIDSENISYTGKTATTFTGCTRAAESTTAATHDDNATVELLITAALPTVHAAAIIAIETKLGSGASIDAAKIADGSISNTEFQYLNGVSSAIQTQIDAKQATFGSQTANTVYAGPTSGGAASPSFRSLVSGDLPTHNQAWSTITSTPTTLSGYGITDAAANGAVTASGLTMATARLLGRSTASTGAIEEISIGSGLTLSAGTLSASGGSSGITVGTTTITSGTNTRVLYNNAGVVGEYAVTGTGNAVLSASPTLTGTVAAAAATFSGTITQTSASATAFESGPNGGTNPVFRLVNNVASAATGLSITGNAAGSGVTLTALSSGTNESILLAPKGTGGVQFPNGAVSTPSINLGDATTGFYRPASNAIGVTIAGVNTIRLEGNNGILIRSDYWFAYASDTSFGSPDIRLRRTAASQLLIDNGGSGVSGLLHGRVVTARTADLTVTAAASNTFYTNTGATGTVTFTLPTAAVGLTYTFYIDAAQTLTIVAGASTTIRSGSSVTTAAGNVTANTQGNLIRVVAISTTQWVAESITGTWTFN